MEYILVMVTCPAKSAEKIAQAILVKRVAACVNITASVKSIYWWKGRMEGSTEKLLLIKTRRSLFSSLEKVVRSVHPYQVPEIIAVPLVEGFDPYLAWIGKETLISSQNRKRA